jgi:hypothetical protein
MRRKLYISARTTLLVLACLIVLASTVFAVHDSWEFLALPAAYRSAIGKLQDHWHYEGLHEDEQAAILKMHQTWQEADKLPWWGADRLADPNQQSGETLRNFEKFVPRWGLRLHQLHPIFAVLLSLSAFIPALALIGLRRWSLWLRSPTPE